MSNLVALQPFYQFAAGMDQQLDQLKKEFLNPALSRGFLEMCRNTVQDWKQEAASMRHKLFKTEEVAGTDAVDGMLRRTQIRINHLLNKIHSLTRPKLSHLDRLHEQFEKDVNQTISVRRAIPTDTDLVFFYESNAQINRDVNGIKDQLICPELSTSFLRRTLNRVGDLKQFLMDMRGNLSQVQNDQAIDLLDLALFRTFKRLTKISMRVRFYMGASTSQDLERLQRELSKLRLMDRMCMFPKCGHSAVNNQFSSDVHRQQYLHNPLLGRCSYCVFEPNFFDANTGKVYEFCSSWCMNESQGKKYSFFPKKTSMLG